MLMQPINVQMHPNISFHYMIYLVIAFFVIMVTIERERIEMKRCMMTLNFGFKELYFKAQSKSCNEITVFVGAQTDGIKSSLIPVCVT